MKFFYLFTLFTLSLFSLNVLALDLNQPPEGLEPEENPIAEEVNEPTEYSDWSKTKLMQESEPQKSEEVPLDSEDTLEDEKLPGSINPVTPDY